MASRSKDEPSDLPEWVSVERAASWLGIPQTTFQDWIDADLVPGPKEFNGRVVRYSRRTLEAVNELMQVGWLPRPETKP